MRHPGQVLSREQLLSQVWGYDFAPESNVVDVYIRYLRKQARSRRDHARHGAWDIGSRWAMSDRELRMRTL